MTKHANTPEPEARKESDSNKDPEAATNKAEGADKKKDEKKGSIDGATTFKGSAMHNARWDFVLGSGPYVFMIDTRRY